MSGGAYHGNLPMRAGREGLDQRGGFAELGPGSADSRGWRSLAFALALALAAAFAPDLALSETYWLEFAESDRRQSQGRESEIKLFARRARTGTEALAAGTINARIVIASLETPSLLNTLEIAHKKHPQSATATEIGDYDMLVFRDQQDGIGANNWLDMEFEFEAGQGTSLDAVSLCLGGFYNRVGAQWVNTVSSGSSSSVACADSGGAFRTEITVDSGTLASDDSKLRFQNRDNSPVWNYDRIGNVDPLLNVNESAVRRAVNEDDTSADEFNILEVVVTLGTARISSFSAGGGNSVSLAGAGSESARTQFGTLEVNAGGIVRYLPSQLPESPTQALDAGDPAAEDVFTFEIATEEAPAVTRSVTVTYAISGTNDRPELRDGALPSRVVEAGTTARIQLPEFPFADREDGDIGIGPGPDAVQGDTASFPGVSFSYDSATREISVTSPDNIVDESPPYRVTVTVLSAADSAGANAEAATFEIGFRNGNAAPVFSGTADFFDDAETGTALAIDLSDLFTDSDGDALTFEIVEGSAAYNTGNPVDWLSIRGDILGGMPVADEGDEGVISLQVTASDSFAPSASVTKSFAIAINFPTAIACVTDPELLPANASDLSRQTPDIFLSPGARLRIDAFASATAVVPDRMFVTPSRFATFPAADWIEFDSASNRLQGMIPATGATGCYFYVWIEDGTRTRGLSVQVNDSPEIESLPVQAASEGALFELDFGPHVRDEQDEISELAFEVEDVFESDGPQVADGSWNWLSFTGSILSGTPSHQHAGMYLVVVKVTDSHGGSVLGDFNIEIENVNQPPSPVENALLDMTLAELADSPVDASQAFRDEDLDPLVYSFKTPLRDSAFLEIDRNTGELARSGAASQPTGAIGESGGCTRALPPARDRCVLVTVVATDPAGESAEASFELTLSPELSVSFGDYDTSSPPQGKSGQIAMLVAIEAGENLEDPTAPGMPVAVRIQVEADSAGGYLLDVADDPSDSPRAVLSLDLQMGQVAADMNVRSREIVLHVTAPPGGATGAFVTATPQRPGNNLYVFEHDFAEVMGAFGNRPVIRGAVAPSDATTARTLQFELDLDAAGRLTFSDDGTIGSVGLGRTVLPAGLSYNAGTRTISGRASESGTFPITVIATDDTGYASEPLEFDLVVLDAAISLKAAYDARTDRILATVTQAVKPESGAPGLVWAHSAATEGVSSAAAIGRTAIDDDVCAPGFEQEDFRAGGPQAVEARFAAGALAGQECEFAIGIDRSTIAESGSGDIAVTIYLERASGTSRDFLAVDSSGSPVSPPSSGPASAVASVSVAFPANANAGNSPPRLSSAFNGGNGFRDLRRKIGDGLPLDIVIHDDRPDEVPVVAFEDPDMVGQGANPALDLAYSVKYLPPRSAAGDEPRNLPGWLNLFDASGAQVGDFVARGGSHLRLSAQMATGFRVPSTDWPMGRHRIVVIARDSGPDRIPGTADDASVWDEFVLEVARPAPPVVANPVDVVNVGEGQDGLVVSLANLFADPEGEPLAVAGTLKDGGDLPGWLEIDSDPDGDSSTQDTSLTVAMSPPPGDIELRVTATDPDGLRAFDDIMVRVIPEAENMPPVAVNDELDVSEDQVSGSVNVFVGSGVDPRPDSDPDPVAGDGAALIVTRYWFGEPDKISTAVEAGGAGSVAGDYGRLRIASDGEAVYTLLPGAQDLRSGVVTDIFRYQIADRGGSSDSSSLTSAATLVVSVEGDDDRLAARNAIARRVVEPTMTDRAVRIEIPRSAFADVDGNGSGGSTLDYWATVMVDGSPVELRSPPVPGDSCVAAAQSDESWLFFDFDISNPSNPALCGEAPLNNAGTALARTGPFLVTVNAADGDRSALNTASFTFELFVRTPDSESGGNTAPDPLGAPSISSVSWSIVDAIRHGLAAEGTGIGFGISDTLEPSLDVAPLLGRLRDEARAVAGRGHGWRVEDSRAHRAGVGIGAREWGASGGSASRGLAIPGSPGRQTFELAEILDEPGRASTGPNPVGRDEGFRGSGRFGGPAGRDAKAADGSDSVRVWANAIRNELALEETGAETASPSHSTFLPGGIGENDALRTFGLGFELSSGNGVKLGMALARNAGSAAVQPQRAGIWATESRDAESGPESRFREARQNGRNFSFDQLVAVPYAAATRGRARHWIAVGQGHGEIVQKGSPGNSEIFGDFGELAPVPEGTPPDWRDESPDESPALRGEDRSAVETRLIAFGSDLRIATRFGLDATGRVEAMASSMGASAPDSTYARLDSRLRGLRGELDLELADPVRAGKARLSPSAFVSFRHEHGEAIWSASGAPILGKGLNANDWEAGGKASVGLPDISFGVGYRARLSNSGETNLLEGYALDARYDRGGDGNGLTLSLGAEAGAGTSRGLDPFSAAALESPAGLDSGGGVGVQGWAATEYAMALGGDRIVSARARANVDFGVVETLTFGLGGQAASRSLGLSYTLRAPFAQSERDRRALRLEAGWDF